VLACAHTIRENDINFKNGAISSPGLGWEDNIRLDAKETWWKVMYWIDLAQNRDKLQAVVSMVMIIQVV
jgi:hypothetical protein